MVFSGRLGPGVSHLNLGGGGEDALFCSLKCLGLSWTGKIALTTIKQSGRTGGDAQKAIVKWLGESEIHTFGRDAAPWNHDKTPWEERSDCSE